MQTKIQPKTTQCTPPDDESVYILIKKYLIVANSDILNLKIC